MPYTLALYKLSELVNEETPNEVLIDTKVNTELHITVNDDSTIISFPFGNKFDIIDGRIIIHEKI